MALHGARNHRQSNFFDYIKGRIPKKLSHDKVPLETLVERADRKFREEQDKEGAESC
ncbi:MAG: hypothetical protein BMS9Abin02_0358 [Anaerolineae bacterium]|nr:MAG: hypothetical protein BMS9Abin02_0358 [Anaerolineae bacterium]